MNITGEKYKFKIVHWIPIWGMIAKHERKIRMISFTHSIYHSIILIAIILIIRLTITQ